MNRYRVWCWSLRKPMLGLTLIHHWAICPWKLWSFRVRENYIHYISEQVRDYDGWAETELRLSWEASTASALFPRLSSANCSAAVPMLYEWIPQIYRSLHACHQRRELQSFRRMNEGSFHVELNLNAKVYDRINGKANWNNTIMLSQQCLEFSRGFKCIQFFSSFPFSISTIFFFAFRFRQLLVDITAFYFV